MHSPPRFSDAYARALDALGIIRPDVAADSGLARMVEDERRRLHLAEMVREACEAAGISQAELARRTGTTQSVVSRIESEDYTGISVSSLLKIAAPLHRRLSLALVSRGA